MASSTLNALLRCALVFLSAFGLVLAWTSAPAFATTATSVTLDNFPAQFGKIVFETRPEEPVRLYIIVNSHRSASSGANGKETVAAQIETFRIGEWLIRRGLAGLILPEGFFGKSARRAPSSDTSAPFDSELLVQSLEDTAVFVNAEMLLRKRYGVALQQIEDRKLYLKTRELLHPRAGLSGGSSLPFATELVYMQKLRSLSVLQKAPEILAKANQEEGALPGGAILTIGLAHLDDIVDFLKTGQVRIPAPRAAVSALPMVETDLALPKSPFGVSVIVPHSLVQPALTLASKLH